MINLSGISSMATSAATVSPKPSCCSLFPKRSSSLSIPHPSGLQLAKSELSSSLSFVPKPPKPFTVCQRSSSLITHAITYPSPSTTPTSSSVSNSSTFHGRCFVVGDNIDTDQIILDEYEKLGSIDVIDLPLSYSNPFIEPGQKKSKYSIVIAGSNFGRDLSHELDPAALEASGVAVVVARSYAPAFLRNSLASRRIHPLESEVSLCEECKTGDIVTVELWGRQLINHSTGKVYKLKLIGDAVPVVETVGGGNSACGRQTGKMIPSHWAHIFVGTVCNLVMVTTLLLAARRDISFNYKTTHVQSSPSSWLGFSFNIVEGNVDK